MDSEISILEERLKSLVFQLNSESEIVERIVYKNKNQHRGSLYFQALLKVRRDLRLLQLARLGQILNNLFHIVRGKKPAENSCHSKFIKKKCLSGNHTYHARLLGVARLLSQMVEPILKAAIQISLLLAKTFFMGFSLAILACLARLRVLVQQTLLDVVSVFNMVSTHSQKHFLKLSAEGIEAFVDCHSSGDNPTLECIWEVDKYVLHESTQCQSEKIWGLQAPIEYQSLELLGADLCTEHEGIKSIEVESLALNPCIHPTMMDQSAATDSSIKSIDLKNSPVILEPVCGLALGKDPHSSSMTQRLKSKSKKAVAFIPVQMSKPSAAEESRPEKVMRLGLHSGSTNNADAFPDFLCSGTQNVSFF